MDPFTRTPLSIVMLDSEPLAESKLIDILAVLNVHVVARESALGIVRQAIAEYEPDVVFVDVNAPNVGGPDAVRQIKRQFPDAKVIGITDYGSCQMMKDMVDAGTCGYIFRSADPYAVRTLIERAKVGDQVYCQGALLMLEQALPSPVPKDRRHYCNLKEEQREVVDLVILGLTSTEIAECLDITTTKVKQRVRAACRGYKVDSRVELVVAALREGVDPYSDPAYYDIIAKYDPDSLPVIDPEPKEPEVEAEPDQTEMATHGANSRMAIAARPADPNDLFEGLLDEWE